jgi:hypothetical protein
MRPSTLVRSAALLACCALSLVACSNAPSQSTTDSGTACKAADGGLLDTKHEACTQPCSTGNELKVGMYCTASGNECDYNNVQAGEAYLCTLSQEPQASLAMCTKACSYNEQCGTVSVCTGDPADTSPTAPRGCVPSACTDDPGRTKAQYMAALDGGMGDAGP